MTGFVDITAERYHADPAETPSLSSSIAKILCTSSAAHAWAAHPKLNPDFARTEETKFDVGNVAHALLLQGMSVAHVVHRDDWRSNAAKEERDAARENGQVPLLAKQWDEVQRMCNAVATQLGALDIDPVPLTGGKPEQSLIWDEDGVQCRARFDWVHDDLSTIDDLKTTNRSAHPQAWSRGPLYSSGNDIQAAFYMRGLETVYGIDRVNWRWIVVETTAPYALSVITPGPDVIALAQEKVTYALRVWRECLESDTWPAYPRTVTRAELPPWAESQWFAGEDHYQEEMAA